MNTLFKKMMVFALAGTMTLGIGTTAFAADEPASNFNTTRENLTDTGMITLIKDYVNGSNTQSDTESPQENFTLTIENYGLWNVGEDGNGRAMYDKASMPEFTTPNVITANEGTAGLNTKPSVNVNVPTYAAVGDYWYKVTETNNKVAGVIYGTNNNQTDNVTKPNNGHAGIYYIHVQVTNGTPSGFIRTVTLHQMAPDLTSVTTNAAYETWYNKNVDDSASAKKVNDIQNKYYAGSLSTTKKVDGNAGDKNELFEVTVRFENTSGASMLSDITYKNFYNAEGNQTTAATSLGWSDPENGSSNTVFEKSFYIKDGATVTFDNIPYGVSYKITETQPADDKYTHAFAYTAGQDSAGSFNGVSTAADTVSEESQSADKSEKWAAANASGSISDDTDAVTITNTKTSVIDIGVVTSNAPYLVMIVLAGVVVLLFVHRRRDLIGE